jgi:hypothetical protein
MYIGCWNYTHLLCVALYVQKSIHIYKNFILIFSFDNFLMWGHKWGTQPKFQVNSFKIHWGSKEKPPKCQVARAVLTLYSPIRQLVSFPNPPLQAWWRSLSTPNMQLWASNFSFWSNHMCQFLCFEITTVISFFLNFCVVKMTDVNFFRGTRYIEMKQYILIQVFINGLFSHKTSKRKLDNYLLLNMTKTDVPKTCTSGVETILICFASPYTSRNQFIYIKISFWFFHLITFWCGVTNEAYSQNFKSIASKFTEAQKKNHQNVKLHAQS